MEENTEEHIWGISFSEKHFLKCGQGLKNNTSTLLVGFSVAQFYVMHIIVDNDNWIQHPIGTEKMDHHDQLLTESNLVAKWLCNILKYATMKEIRFQFLYGLWDMEECEKGPRLSWWVCHIKKMAHERQVWIIWR